MISINNMKTPSQWNDILIQCGVRPLTAAKWAEQFSSQVTESAFSAGASEIDDFLGQILHESGLLEHVEENLNYSAGALMRTWPSRFDSDTAQQYARAPVRIANKVYGGRLGNTEPGDGWKYRGRGLIQCTGKDNYKAVGEAIGIDLVESPDVLMQTEYALKSAISWWEGNIPDSIMGNIVKVSKRVNGGTIGLGHRAGLTNKAGAALA
jgi:putative chitinase